MGESLNVHAGEDRSLGHAGLVNDPHPDVPKRAKRRSYVVTARYELEILAEYETLERDGKDAFEYINLVWPTALNRPGFVHTRLRVCGRLTTTVLDMAEGLLLEWGLRPCRCMRRWLLYQWTHAAVASSRSLSRWSGPMRNGDPCAVHSVLDNTMIV